MIRITIELWPFGRHEEAKSLGVIDIWNDGSGDFKTGNYKYRIWQAGTPKDILHTEENLKKAKWAGYILKFPRKSLLVFDLLYRVLRNTFSYRNGDGHDFSNGVRGKYAKRFHDEELIINGTKVHGRRVRKPKRK